MHPKANSWCKLGYGVHYGHMLWAQEPLLDNWIDVVSWCDVTSNFHFWTHRCVCVVSYNWIYESESVQPFQIIFEHHTLNIIPWTSYPENHTLGIIPLESYPGNHTLRIIPWESYPGNHILRITPKSGSDHSRRILQQIFFKLFFKRKKLFLISFSQMQ